ncbi:hypothetical protein [Nocardioides sp.]|uniref:hypothetical protein n=1 Tax=Nocardioides sp. TaxID=35761 RepID=UPI002ED30551
MRYVGVVIQQLWTDQQGGRAREHHRSRRGDDLPGGDLPGSVRRRLPSQRRARD